MSLSAYGEMEVHRLNSGSSPVHMPDRIATVRPSMQQVLGKLERQVDQQLAELQAEAHHLVVIDRAQVGHAHAPEALEELRARPLDELEVGAGQQHVQRLEALHEPGASWVPMAMSASRRPVRRFSGTRPTMPKSTNVSCHLRLPSSSGPVQRGDEQVAGVRVGVEEAVLEDLCM